MLKKDQAAEQQNASGEKIDGSEGLTKSREQEKDKADCHGCDLDQKTAGRKCHGLEFLLGNDGDDGDKSEKEPGAGKDQQQDQQRQ